MTIDIEYIKKILEEFINCETAFLDFNILDKKYLQENGEKFAFHYNIMQDKILFCGPDDSKLPLTYDCNCEVLGAGGFIRLTDTGHTFYDALQDAEILNKIKKDLKSFGLESMMLLGKKIVEKKLDKLVINPTDHLCG